MQSCSCFKFEKNVNNFIPHLLKRKKKSGLKYITL